MHENDQDDIETLISDLYADASEEKPSSALDEKILSAARKDLQQKSAATENSFSGKGAGPFSGRWTVPASLAAVIILSVTVVVMIEKERPYQMTSPPDEMATIESMKKSDDSSAVKPMLRALSEKVEDSEPGIIKKKHKEEASEHDLRDQELLALQRVEPAFQREAKKPAPVSKPKADASDRPQSMGTDEHKVLRKSIASAEMKQLESTKKETRVATAPSLARETESAKTPAPTEAESATGKSKPSVTVVAESADLAAEAEPAPADDIEPSRLSALAERADADREMAYAKELQQKGADLDGLSAAPAEPAVMMAAPARSFKSQASGSVASNSTVPGNCSTLSISACLKSKECTLELDVANAQYQCRTAAGYCESAFSQAEDTKENCEARAGCKFVPATCFCHPDVECVCGGGPPAMCVPE
ncbi:hypothetical protein [Kaarinaea lacus]